MHIVDKLDHKMWADFVRNHPQGNIFQTPEMFDVYSNTRNYEPQLLAAVNDAGVIRGVLVSVVQREVSGMLDGFTARSVVWGGPLVANNDESVLDLLLCAYEEKSRTRVLYSQFRNLSKVDKFRGIYDKLGYLYYDHLDIIVDLTKSEQELWSSLHSKRRNEIRKAYKEGVRVQIITEREEVDECYAILKSVYTQAGLPLADKTMFDAAFELLAPQEMIKYFGAFSNDSLIGVICILAYKETLYDWYAGSRFEYLKKYPNDVLPWEVFKWGKENGYSVFDFGGAGDPNKDYGVRKFKEKFGGTTVNFGRIKKIHKRVKHRLAMMMFYLWRNLRWKK